MTDPTYDPIAAFAGTLASLGVRDVVISPGSRSTPLAVTFHAHPGLRTHIQLDERSAAFFALGQARASGRPSVLICTSGTAAANYLPAVVEANHACVPMIVCSADRPPELRDWGAGQTIDQVGIYGTNVRWFADLPVPSDWSESAARLTAMRAHDAAIGTRRGPVHLNWPLRKPLEPVAEVPVRFYEPAATSTTEPVSTPADGLFDGDGVIVLGPDAANGIDAQCELARVAAQVARSKGWPLIGEPLSQARSQDALEASEHLLKHPAVDRLRPHVVVRVGGATTTAPVNQWLERISPERVVLIDPEQRWHDASFTTTHHLTAWPADVTGPPSDPGWLARWRALDAAASQAIERVVSTSGRTSASVVRDLCDALPGGAVVMTSNSMPPRDLDSYVRSDTPLVFVGNRGAAGIDGITSTALGVATQVDTPVVVFTGDLALLHDIGGLLGVARSGEHLTVVCIDNDGGQIFSMLPIHGRIGADAYDTIFRTPHGVDLGCLDGMAGVDATVLEPDDDLGRAVQLAVAKTDPGVDLLIVRIDPERDMAARTAVRSAVGESITP